MLGIVSGIVLAYPLTSYPWDSNVRKIDTGTPLFACGDSPDGPQGITIFAGYSRDREKHSRSADPGPAGAQLETSEK
ncbi:hypothetical protein WN51_13988 [Melipona quadrifasciata]|uniref:Uncharacterized protein n=1 Tax=Melipona quadrifasciata TaxID=166423 RepID=A0A0M8ZYV3_9HYME|nr:hypothetical protein WN51_13988 [Melipona quadrifasciata]